MASASASYDGGWLTTIPFSAGSSKSLRLNAKCDFGRIVVELLHADSEMSLPGYFLSDCDVVGSIDAGAPAAAGRALGHLPR